MVSKEMLKKGGTSEEIATEKVVIVFVELYYLKRGSTSILVI